MAAEVLPVATGVWRDQRRSLILWALAVSAIGAMYIAFWPLMGDEAMEQAIASMPEEMVVAMGYDRIGTAPGYLTSTVYGLLALFLLWVFAIGNGARLIAGEEEAGTLELELTSPVARRTVFAERVLALWLDVLLLVAALTLVAAVMIVALDMEVGFTELAAGSLGLFLVVTGMGTVAMAAGAITGRRAVALGAGAALAVLSYIFNAIGPVADASWMTAVSPVSWYLEPEPLLTGFDVPNLLMLAAVPIVAAIAGAVVFERRDLMV